ncbi:hypothetical protein TWF730_003283 [Orbilia blumenaviensis]|uniref:F-box domain-containing protein n=1 Tax=Orbilia blumenaviensis TaxID=1796055 RepID=A0AAV9U7Y5_9PEZI
MGPQALFDESFRECEPLCRFYVHIRKAFGLSLSSNEVPVALAIQLTKQYIQWANPPSPRHKETVQIPEVSALELVETHTYILKWSENFLHEKLQNRKPDDTSLLPSGCFSPPTNTEITRVAKAFYQLFLCLIYLQFKLIDLEGDYHCDEITDIAELQDVLAYAVLETFDYLDLNIIEGMLLVFIGNITRLALTRDTYSHALNFEWYVMAVFGPQELWRFSIDPQPAEPQATRPSIVVHRFTYPSDLIQQVLRIGTRADRYPPFIRVCRRELLIGEGDNIWWSCWTRIGVDPFTTDRWAPIWDDWRLKDWGYHLPMIKLPLYLAGQTPFHRVDCELSTPIVPYIEYGKGYSATKKLFPEVIWPELSNMTGETKRHTPGESLRVGDVLGKDITTFPIIKFPVKTTLPRELQALIIDLAEYSQYATLRAVCKFWKAEAWRALKSRYVEPYRPDKEALEKNPFMSPNGLAPLSPIVPVSPSESPFLIHSALLDFTGYARGRIDRSTRRPVLELGKIYSKPDPDDPLILSSTDHLRAAADYPIIIPNTENPQPLPYSLYAGFSMTIESFHGKYSKCLAVGGDVLKLPIRKRVNWFLASFFDFRQRQQRLRLLPPDGRSAQRFTVRVVKVDGVIDEAAETPGYVEIVFTEAEDEH